MRISLDNLVNKIVWILTTVLLLTFVLFETTAWGRYIFLGITLIVVFLTAFTNSGTLKIEIRAYHGFFALFALFVLASSLWAWSPSDAKSKAITLILILICSSGLYLYYQEKDNIHDLLTAVMWAGYFIALYTIFFYGVDKLGEATEAERLESEFANINSVGMAAALSCVLQFNELLQKRNRWTAVMLIPTVYVLAATQSRKALLFAVGGIYAIYILKVAMQRGFAGKIVKVLGYTLVFCLGAYLVQQLPFFEGVLTRMEGIMTGQSNMESSAEVRSEMVEIGIAYLKKHPIGGIGIGGSHLLTERHLGMSTYLHNNFVELLSCGGIVGFICYYASHIYLLFNLIKYRKADPQFFVVGFVWLVIMLGMDYGMVTYYSKDQWYYLMIHFLNVECLKAKRKRITDETEKNI